MTKTIRGSDTSVVRGKAGVDHVIARLAARQHGVVTRRQLLEAGVGPDVVDRRAGAEQFRRLHHGVYQVGPIAAPLSREIAAVFACGDGAVLSHASAAAGWKILPTNSSSSVDVMVVGTDPGQSAVSVFTSRTRCNAMR